VWTSHIPNAGGTENKSQQQNIPYNLYLSSICNGIGPPTGPECAEHVGIAGRSRHPSPGPTMINHPTLASNHEHRPAPVPIIPHLQMFWLNQPLAW